MEKRNHLEKPKTPQFKLLIKKWSTLHSPTKEKSIFLFSTPRSGSSWLAEMVATQPRFKYVNEPFNIRVPHIRENLGINTWEEFYNSGAEAKIECYLRAFLDGHDHDLRFARPKPFSEFWKLRTSRVVFKILFAGEHNINWFKTKFNGDIIFLVRHPIPVSQSRKSYPRLETFLRSQFAENFSEEQIRYANRIFEKGDKLQHGVLDWCFQNALPLKAADKSWLILSYEQMVLDFPTIVEHLTMRFELEKPQRMLNRAFRASQSTNLSSEQSKEILQDEDKLAKNRRWLIEKWVNKIDSIQISKAGEILEVFGIDYYDVSNSVPNDRYWLASRFERG